MGWYDGDVPNSINNPGWMAPYGVNSILTYQLEGLALDDPNGMAYLDAVEAAGLWEIMEVPRDAVESSDSAALAEYINHYKGHGAISMWQLYDEPEINGVTPAAFISAYQTIKANDTTHEVGAVFVQVPSSTAPSYLSGVDVPSIDSYPVNADEAVPCPDMWIATKKTRDLANAVSGEKVVSVVQAHGGGYTPEGLNLREPTFEEQRYLSLAPLTVGAKGIMYFAYFWTTSEYRTGTIYPVMAQINHVKDAIIEGNVDMIAVTGNYTGDTTGNNLPDMTWRFVGSDNQYFLIAANNTTNTLSNVQFSIDGLDSSKTFACKVHYETASVSWNRSGDTYQLSDSLAPYGVRIYEIAYEDIPDYIILEDHFDDYMIHSDMWTTWVPSQWSTFEALSEIRCGGYVGGTNTVGGFISKTQVDLSSGPIYIKSIMQRSSNSQQGGSVKVVLMQQDDQLSDGDLEFGINRWEQPIALDVRQGDTLVSKAGPYTDWTQMNLVLDKTAGTYEFYVQDVLDDDFDGDTDEMLLAGSGTVSLDYNSAYIGLIHEQEQYNPSSVKWDWIYIANGMTCEDVVTYGQSQPVDLNKDCYVNIQDLSMLASDWMKCNDPEEADCTP